MKTKFLGSAGRFRQGLERLSGGVRHWAGDRRGAIAVQFAFLAVPLTVLAFGLVDLNRMNTQKHNLQDSLDAAALYAARSNATTDAALDVQGDKALNANLQLAPGAQLIKSEFKQEGVKVIADAEIKLPAVISNLWTDKDLIVKVHTEVNRNSNNVEVALVLDTTGSMATGTKLADLKVAAAELIDIVVKPVQTPYYSKVAIVPYSMGVNVGDYAGSVRGNVVPGRDITDITPWKATQKSISSISRSNPAVVRSDSHGLSTGDVVYLWDSGFSSLNNKKYAVTKVDNNKFSLNGVNTGSGDAVSGGKFRACVTSNCDVVVTASSHGFSTGDVAYFTDVKGGSNLTSLVNQRAWAVNKITNDTFSLDGASLSTSNFNYTASSDDFAWCTVEGCEFFRFESAANEYRIHRISKCVSERTGSSAYTDQSPSTSLLGRNYHAAQNVKASNPYSANPCTERPIYPLSTNKDDLKAQITALQASGSTGGHIGVAWGWYMVSPNFGYLWPAASRPAAYAAPSTLKVVVLMTDGEYNSAYKNGVISGDSTNGSGDYRDHIKGNAPNGHSFDQATALCTAMKAAGVRVYTVGFNIVDDQRARDLVNNCATNANHVYIANGGTALKDAFAAIGHEIDNLRLSK